MYHRQSDPIAGEWEISPLQQANNASKIPYAEHFDEWSCKWQVSREEDYLIAMVSVLVEPVVSVLVVEAIEKVASRYRNAA